MVGEVRLAVLTAVDTGRVEIDVVGKTHVDDEMIRITSRGLLRLGWCRLMIAKVRSGHWVLVAACHTC
jgi:ATP phosphoribosyltransferase